MSAMREKIVALHGEKILRKSALRIRNGAGVIERVMAGRGIRTAVEIGCFRGCGSAEMSQYCNRVVTIDLANGDLERHGIDFDRRAFWRSLGIDNIDLHLVRDSDDKASLLNSLEFDFAFIDGAHDKAGVSEDFALTKRCGRVLFHDYDFSGSKRRDAVYDFVNTLPKHQIEVMDIFALWTKTTGETA